MTAVEIARREVVMMISTFTDKELTTNSNGRGKLPFRLSFGSRTGITLVPDHHDSVRLKLEHYPSCARFHFVLKIRRCSTACFARLPRADRLPLTAWRSCARLPGTKLS